MTPSMAYYEFLQQFRANAINEPDFHIKKADHSILKSKLMAYRIMNSDCKIVYHNPLQNSFGKTVPPTPFNNVALEGYKSKTFSQLNLEYGGGGKKYMYW